MTEMRRISGALLVLSLLLGAIALGLLVVAYHYTANAATDTRGMHDENIAQLFAGAATVSLIGYVLAEHHRTRTADLVAGWVADDPDTGH